MPGWISAGLGTSGHLGAPGGPHTRQRLLLAACPWPAILRLMRSTRQTHGASPHSHSRILVLAPTPETFEQHEFQSCTTLHCRTPFPFQNFRCSTTCGHIFRCAAVLLQSTFRASADATPFPALAVPRSSLNLLCVACAEQIEQQ